MTASASSGCCVQYRTARYQPRTTPRTAPGWALMTSRRITNTSTMSPGVALLSIRMWAPGARLARLSHGSHVTAASTFPPRKAAPALAVVETEHGLELQRGLPVQAHRVQGGHQPIELPRRQRREPQLGVLDVGQLDVDPRLVKVPVVPRQEERPVAHPRGIAEV